MKGSTRSELNACISEIESINNELRRINELISQNSQGINSVSFQNELSTAIKKYNKAASHLRKIR